MVRLAALIASVVLSSAVAGLPAIAAPLFAMRGTLQAIALGKVAAEPDSAAPDSVGADTTRADALTAAPAAQTPGAIPPPVPPVAAAALANTLPFADNATPIAVGVAIGVAGYASNGLADVDHALRTIEKSYEAQGYPVPPAGSAAIGPMVLATFTVLLNRSLDVTCQVGHAGNDDNGMRLLGGIVSGRYPLPAAQHVSLHAGLGGGVYGFSFTGNYNVQITPVDGSGGYYELEHIRLKGGGGYWTTGGGLAIRTGPNGMFDLLIQYVGMGDVSTTPPQAATVSVNMSGALFGASFTCFF